MRPPATGTPDAARQQPIRSDEQLDGSGEQATLDAYLDDEISRVRDAAMRRAAISDPDGFDEVTRQIIDRIHAYGTCSADDLDPTIRGGEVGAAFGRLRQTGRIEACGYAISRRPRSHGRLIRVWRAT